MLQIQRYRFFRDLFFFSEQSLVILKRKWIKLIKDSFSDRLTSIVVGYSVRRLLTTSAVTDKATLFSLGFGSLDFCFVFSHSGADIIKSRTKEDISSGSSFEESTTNTLRREDQGTGDQGVRWWRIAHSSPPSSNHQSTRSVLRGPAHWG